MPRDDQTPVAARSRRFGMSFVPPWEFWPRSWFGYLLPRRITLAHNPPVYRWLWWNLGWSK